MSFLPENYKEPVTSNYMKFEEGDNTFRVLGSAKIGWEYWTMQTVDGELKERPMRVREEEQIPMAEVTEGQYGLNLSFFWAFPVYNIEASRIQILTVKQKDVRRQMQGYLKNPKWGDPKDYNFVVTREKIGGKTQYTVSVEPKEKLDKAIIDRFNSMRIDMDVWMAGGDPFKGEVVEEDIAEDVAKALN